MSSIINNVTDPVSKIAINAFGPLETFLKEMDISITGPRHYRDNKTGRMVSANTVLSLFAEWGRNYNDKEKIMTDIDQNTDDNTNEENESVETFNTAIQIVKHEDMLAPLPDWSAMTLEEILPRVAYHRNCSKKGVSGTKKVALTRREWVRVGAELVEKDVLIPVSKVGDGGEYTQFGSNNNGEAEDAYIRQADKARALIVKWQEQGEAMGLPTYRIEDIDKMIPNLALIVQGSYLHPFQDGEDVAEVLHNTLYVEEREAKRQERKQKIARLQNVAAFTKINWASVQDKVEVIVAKAKEEMTNESGFKFDIEVASAYAGEAMKAWFKNDNGDWEFNKLSPMGRFVAGFLRIHGEKAKFNGQNVWKSEVVRDGIKAMYWNTLLDGEAKEINPAVKGTISRYVGATLMLLQGMEVNADEQRRSIGIDANPAWKTPWSEIKMERINYMDIAQLDAIHKGLEADSDTYFDRE